MKTKENVIKNIIHRYIMEDDDSKLKQILKEELSTLNPMKIDEDRMESILIGIGGDAYYKNQTRKAIKIYNSTLENHQVLQPLPKDKPDWFEWSLDTSKYDLWDELVKTYGTPTKKELVSVEELEKELIELQQQAYYGVRWETKLAQHIIDTYSLNPAKREWWRYCEKFMYKGRVYKKYSYEIFLDGHTVLHAELSRHDLKDCTPYIEPSIHDKFMASLSDEQKKMYEEIKESTK